MRPLHYLENEDVFDPSKHYGIEGYTGPRYLLFSAESLSESDEAFNDYASASSFGVMNGADSEFVSDARADGESTAENNTNGKNETDDGTDDVTNSSGKITVDIRANTSRAFHRSELGNDLLHVQCGDLFSMKFIHGCAVQYLALKHLEPTIIVCNVGLDDILEAIATAKDKNLLPNVRAVWAMKPQGGRAYPEKLLSTFRQLDGVDLPPLLYSGNVKLRRTGGYFVDKSYDDKKNLNYDWKESWAEGSTEIINRSKKGLFIYKHFDLVHNIQQNCILKILTFLNAGPDDVVLDLGFGSGHLMAYASFGIGCSSIGIEVEDRIYKRTTNAIIYNQSISVQT
jgi:hypothetical protein